MIAYHNDPSIKSAILAQLETHRQADQIVKGQFWENGKGCAVGCTIHSGNFIEYEARFGIPLMLARLEDAIFEELPNHLAMGWPERFMAAIAPGTDLSKVGWLFLYWLLTDEMANPGINHPAVRDVVAASADIMRRRAAGETVPYKETAEAQASAAEAGRSAAWLAWYALAAADFAGDGQAWAAVAWAADVHAEGVWEMYADKLVSLIEAAHRRADWEWMP